MATSGQVPKPARQKILEGNRSKQAKKDLSDPVEPCPGIPNPPATLTGPAKKEWARMSVLLYKHGLMTHFDLAALASYCAAYGHWLQVERLVKKADKQEAITNGMAPYIRLMNLQVKLTDTLRKLYAELGLSPAARTRVQPVDSNEKRDPAERFFAS